MTKHVSLVSLAPEQFLALKETGACEFDIPESLFDLDTPGHHRRRIKMVSVTIPCVTGPYTSVHCKLQLLKNSYRQSTDLAPGYDRLPTDDATASDDRFVDDRRVLGAIVTSTGQNDAGLFEPGMRDERYLPFEGAGAISRWRLEFANEFKAFDYNTISDVILHLRYTAKDGAEQLRQCRDASVQICCEMRSLDRCSDYSACATNSRRNGTGSRARRHPPRDDGRSGRRTFPLLHAERVDCRSRLKSYCRLRLRRALPQLAFYQARRRHRSPAESGRESRHPVIGQSGQAQIQARWMTFSWCWLTRRDHRDRTARVAPVHVALTQLRGRISGSGSGLPGHRWRLLDGRRNHDQ